MSEKTVSEKKSLGLKGCLSRVFSGFIGCFGIMVLVGAITMAIAAGTGAGILRSVGEQVSLIPITNYAPLVNTKIFDRNGELIEELHRGEDRTSRVPISQISKFLPMAVMAAEDDKFHRHHGIDIPAVIRSVLSNIKAGRVVGGASTITMQLAKCAFLDHEQTMTYKLKQALLAIKLEQKYTKDEIIELYLNQIHFGHGTNGVASASRKFFGNSPDELTLEQSAMLAATIKNPTRYSPWINPERCKERRDYILRRMYNLGYVPEEEMKRAIEEPIEVIERKKEQLCPAPHFIYSFLLPRLQTFFKEKYGSWDPLFDGGYRIFTTLDLRMQEVAEKALTEADIFKRLAKEPDIDGALVSMSPHTGHILAMVGGRSYARSKFNRAVDARRQPGSSFKPFVFLTAIDNGIAPNKIINDIPKSYPDPFTGILWQPRNFEEEYHGPSTLIDALVHSYNIVTIDLLNEIGMENTIRYARKLGIQSPISPTLSMALGSYELTPLEMAGAYSALAAGGVYSEPQYLIRIEDTRGNTIFQSRYTGNAVVDSGSVYVLNDILSKVTSRGTGMPARVPGEKVYGKTGTTNDYTDAWFCGFTKDLATVVFVGCDSPRRMGNRMSSGRVAVPIWQAFMKEAVNLVQDKAAEMKMPANVVKKKVCLDSGFLATADCRNTDNQAFLRGTEPTLECNFHQPFGDMDFFFNAPQDNNWIDTRPTLPPRAEMPSMPDIFEEESLDIIEARKAYYDRLFAPQ